MRKRITILSAIFMMLASSVSCGTTDNKKNYKNSAETFNSWYYVQMDESSIYKENNRAYLLDFDSMETTTLCNVPNCSHKSSDCIVFNLSIEDQLPVIYNNSAYYFENTSSFTEVDGKSVLDLSFKIKKYDFANRNFSDVVEIKNFNANISSGCYLVGSKYYFTTNIGNPEYDEAGNVTATNTGGGGNLFCVDLANGKTTDYGEIFDYESLKKEYPFAQSSLSMYLMGKIESKLYIGINYIKQDVTQEMMKNGKSPIWSGETYTFDLHNYKIEKLDDEFSMCSMNDYHSYFEGDQNVKLTLQNIKTGEIFSGPDILSWNAMTIFDDKVWHDDAKCFDIKTGEETTVSTYDYGQVIAEYEDSYIFMGTDDNGKTVFEKLPKSDFE